MILDDKEKERFIEWLEITAESCGDMVKQLEKLPDTITLELARREKQTATACLIIAAYLKSAEPMNISKP